MMIADIAAGNTGWADVFFLLAVVLCVLVVLAHFIDPVHPRVDALAWAAVGFIAAGLLVL